jgi:sulfonate transport system ATP-binding protein
VLLLDEPFSALDAFTRVKLQDHLLDLWRAEQPTMLFVTHDIEEALVLADRILLLSNKPTRMLETLAVTAPRPRDIAGSDDLQRQRARLHELFTQLEAEPAAA